MASRLEVELDDGETRVMKLVDQALGDKATIESVRIEYWGEEGGIIMSLSQYNRIFWKYWKPPQPETNEEEDQFADFADSESVATRRLEYLSLHHTKLAGSAEEFESLRESLQSNRSLQEVNLSGCSSVESLELVVEDEIDNSVINHGSSVFLQALANLPSLKKLHMEGVYHLSIDGMTSLCQSSTLKTLELWNMAGDLNQYGAAMAEALPRGKLQELEISSKLQSTVGNAMANMLEHNTELKSFGFDIDYSDFGESLARVLQPGHNQALESLHLRIVSEAPLVADEDPEETKERVNKYNARVLSEAHTLIRALEHNNLLEHLHINFYAIPPDAVRDGLVNVLEELLEVNFALQNVTLRGNHRFSDLGPKVDFLLRLNRAGRSYLLLGEGSGDEGGSAPRSRWVETIMVHQMDTDIVFYLLLTNPSLCTLSQSDAG